MTNQAKSTVALNRETKAGKLVALLQRKQGATLDEMVQVNGWLPHTTRAALTGLKKKGHAVERTKVDGVSRYLIKATAKTKA